MIATDLVHVQACQLCGSTAGEEMFTEPPFRVIRCQECSLVYVTPRRDDSALHAMYNGDYWNSESPKTRGYASYAEDESLYLARPSSGDASSLQRRERRWRKAA